MSIIYRITNNINNKSYIGQTIFSLEKRLKSHYCDTFTKNSKTKFHNALRKHPTEVWVCEIIEEVDDINLLNEREIYWIFHYDTFKNGYNSTSGGVQYIEITEETKNKISKANKGKSSPNKGKKATEEAKEKMRQAKLGEKNNRYGKHHSDETKEKMSKSAKNKPKSEKHKLSLSKAKIGKPSPNKGKTTSEETKAKLRQAALKRWNNGVVNTSIKAEEIEKYVLNGYKLGML